MLPRCIGEELGRLVDETDLAQLGASSVLNVLLEGQFTHGMTHRADLIQVEVVEEVSEIGSHALDGWRCRGQEFVASVAPGIPAVDPMMAIQRGEKRKPFLMTGSPAMQHDDRRTIAGNLNMDLFTVVGKKVGHGNFE